MSDVIPTGLSPDSEFLFERMTDGTLEAADYRTGASAPLVLDVASGVGQDSVALAKKGARVVGAEPSARMTAMAEAFSAEHVAAAGSGPDWVRGWADELPFGDDHFDAAFCKGAMDHFDTPEAAISEMARVTRNDGRVVLAIANFDSLACRVTRAVDEFREDWLGWGPLRGRRGYDTPSDHFTRYDLDLMKEQAARHLEITEIVGISIGWGMPLWSWLTTLLPKGLTWKLLQGLDAAARRWPTLADVIVVIGKPRGEHGTPPEVPA